MSFKKSLNTSGYDNVEAYFYERDRELIAKMKEKGLETTAKPVLKLVSSKKQTLLLPQGSMKKAA